MLAALVFYVLANTANAQEPYPRPDYVTCMMAVEPLESGMRQHLQSGCIDYVETYCAAEVTGPWRDCAADVTEEIEDYVISNRHLLPDDIVTDRKFRAKSYRFLMERLSEFNPNPETCVPVMPLASPDAYSVKYGASVLDIQDRVCRIVRVVAVYQDLQRGARYAGITLPHPAK